MKKEPASAPVRRAASSATGASSSSEWVSEAKPRRTQTAASQRTQNSVRQAPARKSGGGFRLNFGAASKIDWPVIVAVSVCILILLGILALMIFGIVRCSNGCSNNNDKIVNAGKLQIYTPAPDATPFVETTSAPYTESTATPGTTTAPETTAPQTTDVPEVTLVPAVNVSVPSVPQNTEGLRSATIRSIGDFVIHEEVFLSAKRLAVSTNTSYGYNFAPMIDPVWDVIGNADFTVANVDGCLGGRDSYKYGYSGYPQFNTPEHILFALRDSSVDMLTLANNHMLDGWFDGLMNTIKNVESVGIKVVGASRSADERAKGGRIYEINGIKVGFLNYTQSLNTMDKAKGLDPRAMEFAVHAFKNSNGKLDAKALRDAGAEVIVCYAHWGEEYRREPDTTQKNYAKVLMECGVDVIIGGHPHMVQKAEWITGTNQFGEEQQTLCLYSLGNFLSFQREQYKDGGIIFDFTIQEQPDGSFSITNPGYLPVWVWMTGTDKNSFNFSVLNIADYINNKPANMSQADYQKMLTSYNDSISIMNMGVGALLTK